MAEHNLVKYTEHISFTANNPASQKPDIKYGQPDIKPIIITPGTWTYKPIYTLDELVGTFG